MSLMEAEVKRIRFRHAGCELSSKNDETCEDVVALCDLVLTGLELLRQAKRRARHLSGCPAIVWANVRGNCTCGLADYLSRINVHLKTAAQAPDDATADSAISGETPCTDGSPKRHTPTACDAAPFGRIINYVHSTGRMLLYTDTMRGQQISREDMWAITTSELNDIRRHFNAQARRMEVDRAELLAALEGLVRVSESYIFTRTASERELANLHIARAAIAKAKGETE